MGVAVVFAGLVMLVVGALGGELLEPFPDVLNQAAFQIVYIDGGGDMHGRDKTEAILDAAAAHDLLDLVGDVDHGFTFFCFENEVFGMALHFSIPWADSLFLKR